ncbi:MULTISPECIES: hypothetical protein [Thermoleptolyngbya]|nr:MULTISPECIES: hypothetical protein [Thermoleptolyngbya]
MSDQTPTPDPAQPVDQFLTPEECAEVDRAMMTASDRFSARVAIYSLRCLQQIAQQSHRAIADLSPQQVANWVEQDPSLSPEKGFDDAFKVFFGRLVISSLKPLHQIAAEADQPIETLTVPQVVAWFEQSAKQRIERQMEQN